MPAENDHINAEVAAFLDVVTQRGIKLERDPCPRGYGVELGNRETKVAGEDTRLTSLMRSP